MPRYLVTGSGGFVGKHFLDFLSTQENVSRIEVRGFDICLPKAASPPYPFVFQSEVLNLRDKERLEAAIVRYKPDYLIHLAAVSSVAASWENPADCISNNTQIFINVLEIVRLCCPQCRILAVGSSEVYDTEHRDNNSPPLTETALLYAANPYALGRQMQESITRFYAEQFGMDIVATRSFSHTGTGQGTQFAVPAFIQQLLEAKKNKKTVAELKTGNIDLIRDYTDVRDVVRAYELLLQKGKSGEIYNVCSGKRITLRKTIETASELLKVPLSLTIDPARLRPNEQNYIVGSPAKLQAATGWMPEYTLDQTLSAMIAACD